MFFSKRLFSAASRSRRCLAFIGPRLVVAFLRAGDVTDRNRLDLRRVEIETPRLSQLRGYGFVAGDVGRVADCDDAVAALAPRAGQDAPEALLGQYGRTDFVDDLPQRVVTLVPDEPLQNHEVL